MLHPDVVQAIARDRDRQRLAAAERARYARRGQTARRWLLPRAARARRASH